MTGRPDSAIDGEPEGEWERKMKTALLIIVAASLCFLIPPHFAEAHHGWAEFDSTRELTFDGTVTDFHFVNPHCVVEFDAKDEKGQVHKWQGEFSNPGILSRQGWTAASLQIGDKVSITGNPAKNNSPALHVARIRLPSGQEFKIDGGR
jgi:hypothetical protein